MEQAASALLRLTRQPTGEAAWRGFHTTFCDRYGTGTLVPLAEVVDPGAGLGYPAGYPGNLLSPPTSAPSQRDEHLLALALLSTAMRRGVTVTGQATAIGRICAWLDQWRSGS